VAAEPLDNRQRERRRLARARLRRADHVAAAEHDRNRLRLNLAIKPVSWLKFVFQAQDSRSFFTNVSPVPASQKDPIDLRMGYVQVGNSETGWLSLTAGRQALNFGEGRLVADPQWSNVGRSFDAVRMTLHHNNLKLDIFSGASDKIYINGFYTPTPGEHFDGLYGSIEKWIPDATIEPYLFWRMEHNFKGEVVKFGNLDETTGREIIELLFAGHTQRGTTLVLVTHDAALARRCGRVVRLRSGHIDRAEQHA